MDLIEPLGLLHGRAAEAALETGLARAMPGGAYSLARLWQGDASYEVAAAAMPAGWHAQAAQIARPAAWMGWPDRPLVMGILNVTPDSFSDGGRYVDIERAIAAGRQMINDGADLLDIGGETTRPGAQPVPPAIEAARILPVICALRHAGVPISADTRNASTMQEAVEAGATIINDVSGLTHDPAAPATLARLGCGVIIMHMRGTPADMHTHAQYQDVARDVTRELAQRLRAAHAAGIPPDRIVVDPGIGFAKTGRQTVELLNRLPVLLNLERRILVGASRKRFIGRLVGEPDPARRDPGSLAIHLMALQQGAGILRVHDVPGTVQAVRVWQGCASENHLAFEALHQDRHS